MEENIYLLSDNEICNRIGRKIRELRLRQNITQISLAEQTQVSLSTIKKIENGAIGSFDSLMRILRVLGELDIFTPLLEEYQMSPNEYLKFVEDAKKRQRKRATRTDKTAFNQNQTDSEW